MATKGIFVVFSVKTRKREGRRCEAVSYTDRLIVLRASFTPILWEGEGWRWWVSTSYLSSDHVQLLFLPIPTNCSHLLIYTSSPLGHRGSVTCQRNPQAQVYLCSSLQHLFVMINYINCCFTHYFTSVMLIWGGRGAFINFWWNCI